jgi:hypothetical protein
MVIDREHLSSYKGLDVKMDSLISTKLQEQMKRYLELQIDKELQEQEKSIMMMIGRGWYLTNTTPGHNKDYVIVEINGVYYSSWGARGQKTLGWSILKGLHHAGNLREAKIKGGYSLHSEWKADLNSNVAGSVIITDAKIRIRFILDSMGAIVATPASRTIPIEVELSDIARSKLKLLREYLEFNPGDTRMMEFAKTLGTKSEAEINTIIETSEEGQILDRPSLVQETIFLLKKIEEGNHLIKEYLRKLDSKVLKVLFEDKQIEFLRGLFKRKTYTLFQMRSFATMQEKIYNGTIGSDKPVLPIFNFVRLK